MNGHHSKGRAVAAVTQLLIHYRHRQLIVNHHHLQGKPKKNSIFLQNIKSGQKRLQRRGEVTPHSIIAFTSVKVQLSKIFKCEFGVGVKKKETKSPNFFFNFYFF